MSAHPFLSVTDDSKIVCILCRQEVVSIRERQTVKSEGWKNLFDVAKRFVFIFMSLDICVRIDKEREGVKNTQNSADILYG